MTDIDALDYEYFRDKTYEYAAMRAKLRELVKQWRTPPKTLWVVATRDLADYLERVLAVAGADPPKSIAEETVEQRRLERDVIEAARELVRTRRANGKFEAEWERVRELELAIEALEEAEL